MSIEQSVIFCDYNTRLMDVPKSCFLPNKIGHKTTNMPNKFIFYYGPVFTILVWRSLQKSCSRISGFIPWSAKLKIFI